MNVSRLIGIYEKHGDKHLNDVSINLPIDILTDILNVDKEDDPYVYKPYDINKSQFEKLTGLVPELKKYDFDKYFFSYECFNEDYGK